MGIFLNQGYTHTKVPRRHTRGAEAVYDKGRSASSPRSFCRASVISLQLHEWPLWLSLLVWLVSLRLPRPRPTKALMPGVSANRLPA